ncbi:hypothetical protein QE152_g35258 [Popillia japonica]|uniref:PiggyBac transposable element-derived protein domain-containing protein n=1 Tax=Popillia japonica TaxID=7064 RepID=A0AAW1IGM4_POPJA
MYGPSRDCVPTDLEELMAFLGLLYLVGIKRGQHLNTYEFWATDGAPDYFNALTERRTVVDFINLADENVINSRMIYCHRYRHKQCPNN